MADPIDNVDMGTRSARARRLSLELREPRFREAAIEEIAAAFEHTEGNAVHAAERLKIGHRTLMRFVAEVPQLERVVRAIRRKHGHPHEVGEPARRKD